MMLAELSFGAGCFLVLAIGMALAFEFVNGFHDTANAVATVIYTHTLKPWVAVIWSGCWNLTGVMVSSGAVAFAVLSLLPVELVVNVGSGAGFAMVFALLISAIIWNLGTWYLGLPASSSHTLIGSIMGVGLANSLLAKGHVFGEGVNWAKAGEVFSSLLISPVIGFVGAGALLLIAKLLIRKPELYKAPPKDVPPPTWIRGLLILTCTGVSFFHGSNDGQKGMGLLLLILIGILPATYALNMDTDPAHLRKIEQTAAAVEGQLASHSPGVVVAPEEAGDELSAYLKTTGKVNGRTFAALATMNRTIVATLAAKTSLAQLPAEERKLLRTNIYLEGEAIGKLNKQHLLTDGSETTALMAYKGMLDKVTKFLPTWVKVAVALALGLGTMIGW